MNEHVEITRDVIWRFVCYLHVRGSPFSTCYTPYSIYFPLLLLLMKCYNHYLLFQVRKNSFISGKMIKLSLTCRPFGGKPCLLLKTRGNQNCKSNINWSRWLLIFPISSPSFLNRCDSQNSLNSPIFLVFVFALNVEFPIDRFWGHYGYAVIDVFDVQGEKFYWFKRARKCLVSQ